MMGLQVHTGAPAEHGDGEESGRKEEKENRKEWQWGRGTRRRAGDSERPWGIVWNSAPKCLPCSTVASEM